MNIEQIRNGIPPKANRYCLDSEEYLLCYFGRIKVYRNNEWIALSPAEVEQYQKKNSISLSHLDAYELVQRVGNLDDAKQIVYGGLEPKQSGFWFWDLERQDHSYVSSEDCIYIPDLRKAIQKIDRY